MYMSLKLRFRQLWDLHSQRTWHSSPLSQLELPCGSDGKKSACKAGIRVWSLVGRFPRKGNGYPSSILAWRIPWTGGVHTVHGSQRVRHDWATHTWSQLSSTIFSLSRQSQPLINHIIVRRKKPFFIVWVFMTFITFWLVMKLSGLVKVKVQVTQLCLTPCDPMDYTVHGILQARILGWVAFPFSTWVSALSQKNHISLRHLLFITPVKYLLQSRTVDKLAKKSGDYDMTHSVLLLPQ